MNARSSWSPSIASALKYNANATGKGSQIAFASGVKAKALKALASGVCKDSPGAFASGVNISLQRADASVAWCDSQIATMHLVLRFRL